MVDKGRIYTDEHIPRAVVMGLRRRGVEVLTCHGMAMLSVAGETHLDLATRQRRIVINQEQVEVLFGSTTCAALRRIERRAR